MSTTLLRKASRLRPTTDTAAAEIENLITSLFVRSSPRRDGQLSASMLTWHGLCESVDTRIRL